NYSDISTETAALDSVEGKDALHSDEATLAQQEAIESDIKASSPLISEVLPLTTLDEDFSGHPVYLEKLELLKKKYTGIRRLRRDGNCFYRAFGFAYIEYLLNGKRLKQAERLKSKCDECRDALISFGYTQFTVEDFHEQFTAMVDRFTVDGEPLAKLEATFNDQAYSDYYVVFLRLLVSAYMQKNAPFYADFIDEGRTISQFCETEVEPMTRECDNIHVAALALAVGIPIAIENCQQSGELTRIVFPARVDGGEDANTGSDKLPSGEPTSATQPPVTLLYRPGHYDILYAG
ncbi:hypothetical protein T265_14197, partial [Opisthorchis viverrini]